MDIALPTLRKLREGWGHPVAFVVPERSAAGPPSENDHSNAPAFTEVISRLAEQTVPHATP